ncbi:MAG: MgtC/SapB family protein [Patescibacteria group bacterium]|jgi:putative Mg2+ transporter-C (MgtC) family protein
MMLTTGQIIFRLLLSAVLTGLIGLEREYRHKPAGLRTNILVGVGSTLVMLMSIYVASLDNGDPTRIAAGVLTGIGFLGAGVIIRGQGQKEDEEMVHGITTAATIWVISAIGLAIGLGFYFAAIFTTLISLSVLYGLNSDRIRDKMETKKNN